MANKHALVVDDSKVGRLSVKKKLEAFGVQVETAESGHEALDFLARQRPDMIFMDHQMPDMDGFEVTRRIKSSPDTRDIPVVIVSGSDEEAFVREARSHGAYDAICKPPADDVLAALLKTLAEAAAQQPVPAAAAATPTVLDPTAVQSLLDGALADFRQRIYGDLVADLQAWLTSEGDRERQAQADREMSQDGRIAQLGEALAGLSHEVAASAAHAAHWGVLENRLRALEAEGPRPVPPDLDEWLAEVERRVAPRLDRLCDEVRASVEDRATQAHLDGLRESLTGLLGDAQKGIRVDLEDLRHRVLALDQAGEDPAAQWTVRLESVEARLLGDLGAQGQQMDRLAQDVAGLTARTETLEASRDEARAAPADTSDVPRGPHAPTMEMEAWVERLVDQRLEQREATHVPPTPSQSGQVTEADSGEAMAEAMAAMQSELDALRTQWSEERIQQVLAQALAAGGQPDSPVQAAGSDVARWQSEVDQLKARVKRLTLGMVVGGATLLAALVALVLTR